LIVLNTVGDKHVCHFVGRDADLFFKGYTSNFVDSNYPESDMRHFAHTLNEIMLNMLVAHPKSQRSVKV